MTQSVSVLVMPFGIFSADNGVKTDALASHSCAPEFEAFQPEGSRRKNRTVSVKLLSFH
jgi:hypothetical protein